MAEPAQRFAVVRTPAFVLLLNDYEKHGHRKLDDDIAWLEEKLMLAPEAIGDSSKETGNGTTIVYHWLRGDTTRRVFR